MEHLRGENPQLLQYNQVKVYFINMLINYEIFWVLDRCTFEDNLDKGIMDTKKPVKYSGSKTEF